MSQGVELSAQEPAVTDVPVVPAPSGEEDQADALVIEDLLVEDISIDGMCGVY
jgi:mycofactocin precursor